ncbi:hypothetical protein [Butyricicoccus sp. Marseille-Q5471]|uniref:hypothetical protein n=1 Tax=Butyricicoccus sp. Marseille-Q5471 TaxID=3039493 RepID=UPI0024BC4C20|nr:hypothetical protein [Butyricicoccus sp. Marseille-Q5471]
MNNLWFRLKKWMVHRLGGIMRCEVVALYQPKHIERVVYTMRADRESSSAQRENLKKYVVGRLACMMYERELIHFIETEEGQEVRVLGFANMAPQERAESE